MRKKKTRFEDLNQFDQSLSLNKTINYGNEECSKKTEIGIIRS